MTSPPSATIPSDLRGNARFVARAPGVLAGLMVVERLVEQFESCRCGGRTVPTATGWSTAP